jgi:hypothetical protein
LGIANGDYDKSPRRLLIWRGDFLELKYIWPAVARDTKSHIIIIIASYISRFCIETTVIETCMSNFANILLIKVRSCSFPSTKIERW